MSAFEYPDTRSVVLCLFLLVKMLRQKLKLRKAADRAKCAPGMPIQTPYAITFLKFSSILSKNPVVDSHF